ncbi:12000_t:CDS:2, partial [Dentiscutata erythropus]
MVNNEELMTQQKTKGKEFLLTEKTLFAQSIENIGRTNTTTYSINTGNAAPIKQGYYKAAYKENDGQVGIKAFCQEPATHAVVKGTARKVLKHHRLKLFLQGWPVEVLPQVRNDAVRRVEKVQESAKRKYDQDLQHIEEIKRGDQ